MEIKGIIFDLDGTLLDSLEDLADSTNYMLERNGFKIHPTEAYKTFIGNGIKNLIKTTLPETNIENSDINVYFNEMYEHYKHNCLNKTKLYEGIAEMLDVLKLKELKIAVFSNKADELTKKITDKLLLTWNFDSVRGLENEELKKPNPKVALEISEVFGLSTNEIMYVGDSGVDMQTANNAGMSAVGVLWGFRTAEELKDNGAKYLVEHPSEIIDLIKNI